MGVHRRRDFATSGDFGAGEDPGDFQLAHREAVVIPAFAAMIGGEKNDRVFGGTGGVDGSDELTQQSVGFTHCGLVGFGKSALRVTGVVDELED